MNTHFDCNNSDDFVIMSCRGELCPNKQVEMRSVGGDQRQYISYEEQIKKLCAENNKNLLDLLIQIYDKIMRDMLVRGNNVPLFKTKVNSVLNQWSNTPDFDDFFAIPSRETPFNYDDVDACNAGNSELGNRMKELEVLVANDSDNLYHTVANLQSDCKRVDDDIGSCLSDLDSLTDYEPRYSNVLLDLSTKPKSFYTQMDDETDGIRQMVYHKNFRELPESLPEIFSNAVFIPNMITKESEHIKEILRNLRGNVREKQHVLKDLSGNIPERRQLMEPLRDFFKSLMESSGEESSGEESSDDEGERVQSPGIPGGTGPDKSLTPGELEDIEGLLDEVSGEMGESVSELEISETDEKDDGTPEVELLKLAKKQQGGEYELSFF